MRYATPATVTATVLVLIAGCARAPAAERYAAPEARTRVADGSVADGSVADESVAHESVERLAMLGQVWGFLKYFHPGVAAGVIDWDSTLVATVPQVLAGASADEFVAVFDALLDAAGSVPPCDACQRAYPDSMLHNYDMRWLDAVTARSSPLGARLAHVLENRHQGPGRYIDFYPYSNHADFRADTAYSAPDYPDEAVRLLALFRYWNAVHYFFAYSYVNDGDWNDVLHEFIPRMRDARDATAYHLAVLELTTRVSDTHVATQSTILQDALGARVPAFEARSVEGRIVVRRPPAGAAPDTYPLRAGDIITHVNGETVEERRSALARFVAAGNPATYERNIVGLVLRSSADSVTYSLLRDGAPITRRVAMGSPAEFDAPRPRPEFAVTDLVRVLPDDIGYVDMGALELTQMDSALAILRNTNGIVMDVRNYPRGTLFDFAAFLNPAATPFVTFTEPDPTLYGAFREGATLMAGQPTGNPDHYVGRIAILIDERTQSHSEFTVMALQTAPENRVVGSQTAGADGNVTPVFLPGGIRTRFTGLGVYYPDGRQTQRVGIVPDIEVLPTIEGVRAGRDEVLERAIEYIRTGN